MTLTWIKVPAASVSGRSFFYVSHDSWKGTLWAVWSDSSRSWEAQTVRPITGVDTDILLGRYSTAALARAACEDYANQ